MSDSPPDASGAAANGPVAPGPLLLFGGLLIASVSAMCGIGGGIFAVPVLHYLFGVPLKRAVATSLCLVWCVAISSTTSEFFHSEGALYPQVVLLLIGGVLVGTQIGYEIARRVDSRRLKGIFCVVLLVVGARILFLSGGGGGLPAESIELGVTGALTVGGIGVGAGIVVPILGVGGGLIVVPALLLGLPEVGILGARATSLAAAIVSSSRSLWLYNKDEMVDWSTGAWFGVGAALGGAIGVQLVHRPGGAAIGEVLLGVVLVFAASRFGWDVFKPRDEPVTDEIGG